MKYAKMLALAAVAASALMAFIGAGTASATTLCSTTVEKCPEAQKVTGVLDFSLTKETSANLVETGAEPKTLDTCKASTVKGTITNSGGATSTPSGPVEELTWSSCTFPTKTITKGGLEVH